MKRFTAVLSIVLTFVFLTPFSATAQHQQHHDQPGQQGQGMMNRPDSMQGGMMGMMQGNMMGQGMMGRGMMQMMRGMHRQMMQNPMHRAQMTAFMLPALADTLGLSEEQLERINQLKKDLMAQRQQHQQQMMVHRQQMMALFEGDTPPATEAVRQHLTAMAELRAGQQAAMYETAQEIRQVLTAEQRQTLESLTPQQKMRQMMSRMPMMEMMQMMRSMHGSMMGSGMMGGPMMQQDSMLNMRQSMPMMQRGMKNGNAMPPKQTRRMMGENRMQNSQAQRPRKSAALASRLSGPPQLDTRKASGKADPNKVYVMMGPSNTIAAIELNSGVVSESIPVQGNPHGGALTRAPQGAKRNEIPVQGNPHGGALTPDGSRIYAASMSTERMTVVDTNDEEVMAKVNLGAVSHHTAIRQDGRYVYAAAGQVKVIDTEVNEVVASIETTDSPFYPLLSPNGRTLYVLSSGTTISVIDTETNTVTGTIEMGARSMMGHLALAPDGETLYVTNDADGLLSIIDVSSGQLRTKVPVGGQPHGVAVSTDGERVYVSDRTGKLVVVDAKTQEVIETRDLGGSPEHLSMTTDGGRLIVGLKNRFQRSESSSRSGTMTDAIAVIDSRSLDIVAEIPVWAQVHDILVSATGE